jgi:hypothetical protein
MRTTVSAFSCFFARRGFNLIEAAIVLGVIGLVIGGIWVAAASVQREIRRKAYVEIILDMRSKVSEKWTGFQMPVSGSVLNPLTNTLYPSAQLLSIAGMPSVERDKWDWVVPGGHVYVHPSGIYGGVSNFSSNIDTLSYGLGYVDRADCVWLARSAPRIVPYDGGMAAANPAHPNHRRMVLALPGGGGIVFDQATPDLNAMANWANTNCEAGATNVFVLQTGRP